MAACKTNQCLGLIFGEWLATTDTMARFGFLFGLMSHKIFRKVRSTNAVDGTGNICGRYIDGDEPLATQ